MSSKSKYNRRNISQTANPANPGAAVSAQTVDTRNMRSGQSANLNPKVAFDMAAASMHFKSELKWIGAVTTIILVLMIVSYYIFR